MKRVLLILLALCLLLPACGKSTPSPAPDKPNGPADPGLTDENGVTKPSVTIENTPVIYIDTMDGVEIPTDKTTVNCTVKLQSKDAAHCAEGLTGTVRCRGNGSMTVGDRTGKYPYKLKFDQKINLFDLGDGEAREWVLIANVGDITMLRNYAAKLMGDLLDGIPYSPNARPVNVYLNGEYIGVYELTEQVEVRECRVNVNDSLTGKKNGFLVELDYYAKYPEEGDVTFRLGGQAYTVKSEVYNDDQLQYIIDCLTEVEEAIYDGDEDALDELVDMDSLVDMYLLHEFAKNIDAGFSSFFMYQEVDGKLYFAPPWDFDLAFGNDDRLDGGSYEELYVGEGRHGFMQNHLWYIELFKNDWFIDLAARRWKEITKTVVPEVIEQVQHVAEVVGEDMGFNYGRWKFLGKKQQQEPREVYILKTYEEHVDYLVTWMQNRKEWLDMAFGV